MRRELVLVLLMIGALTLAAEEAKPRKAVPPVVRVSVGQSESASDGSVRVTLVDKRQNFSMAESMAQYRDSAINSPKSVNIHPDGKKYYVNSLEGCKTVVYDLATNKRLKVIEHRIGPEQASLWAPTGDLFRFTHYEGGERRPFRGKPVESTFSHGGRYLWVPYYRRDFDLNAQDPSAVAVIDTRSDEIIRLFATGPLPKMIECSHDGRTIAVTHWGNNTVGLIDITGQKPEQWKYITNIGTPTPLPLNFSLTQPVNRDSHSGLLLRGTVFTPDDRYLLVSSMSGGGIRVIDVAARKYLGALTGCNNPRHLVIKDDYLYLSCNVLGTVQRCPLSRILDAIATLDGGTASVSGWETCKVGGGARTLSLSPSGRFAFVACNSASKLCVIDTRKMAVVTQIDVDSYPVGLDLSDDGSIAIVTSQGREGSGGNAVNIYRVEYAEPEPVIETPAEECTQPEGDDAQATVASGRLNIWLIVTGIAAILLVALLAAILSRRRSRKH